MRARSLALSLALSGCYLAHERSAPVDAGPMRTDAPENVDAGPPPLSAVGIAIGPWHATATLSDGTLRAWGANAFGGLGDGTTTDRPLPIPLRLSEVASLVPGDYRTFALTSSRRVFAWGYDLNCELGDGSVGNHLVPGVVPALDGTTQVADGCALRSDGTVLCWCWSDPSALTGAGLAPGSPTPVPIPGVVGAVETTSSCARLSDGTVLCWGDNEHGQVGDGTRMPRTRATPVIGVAGATRIRNGFSHRCAVIDGGHARCWGNDDHGQLGDRVHGESLESVAVQGLDGIVDLALGIGHTCALRTDETVWCWGDNAYAALGDGTTTPRDEPGPVPGLAEVIAIGAGNFFNCALVRSGEVYCWGNNQFGQLGNGDVAYRFSPTRVEF
jgi:alpha-tubulin suppressor-like RCC1 family protein